MIDLVTHKERIIDEVRKFLSPNVLDYSSTISNLDNTLSSYFYVWDNTISSISFYIHSISGNTVPLIANIRNEDTNEIIKSSTITPTVGWNTIPVGLSIFSSDLISLNINPMDYLGYCNFGASTIDNHSYLKINGTLSDYRLSTSIPQTKTLIYDVFPSNELSAYQMPVITFDIVGRNRVLQRYIDPNVLEEELSINATIYAITTKELDKLTYFIDKILFKKRRYWEDYLIISPSGITPISKYGKENILFRGIMFNIRIFVRNTR